MIWVFIPDPDPDFLPIPVPGSRGQKGAGSRVRIRNTGSMPKVIHFSNVTDPDPPDPHVFRPPGSGSINQRCGSDPDPSIIKQK
jgi:hypothetical protein